MLIPEDQIKDLPACDRKKIAKEKKRLDAAEKKKAKAAEQVFFQKQNQHNEWNF